MGRGHAALYIHTSAVAVPTGVTTSTFILVSNACVVTRTKAGRFSVIAECPPHGSVRVLVIGAVHDIDTSICRKDQNF